MSYRQYRPNDFPPMVKNLMIINALVFLAQTLLRSSINLTDLLALYPVNSPEFEPYQIATHMFAHGSFQHILFNMFSLWMFGRLLENVWGPKRFLLFYLVCGVGAAALHLLVQYLTGSYESAIGASGAVMGLVAGFATLFPNSEVYIYFMLPLKAKYLALIYAAIDLFGGLQGTDNIAHFAHLGGAITGFIMVKIFNKMRKNDFY